MEREEFTCCGLKISKAANSHLLLIEKFDLFASLNQSKMPNLTEHAEMPHQEQPHEI